MKKWKLGFTALFMGMLILTGCSDSKETNEQNDASSSNEKTYTIGITQFVEHPSLDEATKGFKQAIADSGLSVTYDEKSAQNDQNNTNTIAQNFVAKKVDLIFANATPSAQAAVNATKEIPIVFTSITDPVAAGLVESMENPGGNATGTADSHPDAVPNTMKFISEQMGFKTVGTVYNAGETNSTVLIEEMKAEAKKLGLSIVEQSVSTSSEVKQATEALVGKVDCIYIITDNTVVSALESVIQVANDKDIPLFVGELDSVKRGGFAAYGFSFYDIGYDAGKMAVEILRDGKKPADIPALFPTNLMLQINKTAAAEMGIEIKEDEWKEAVYIE